ncbi:hypothetical protein TWF694_011114 [Orbilia ellipsospora]|uniref:tyrosine--tRNA ligase n=1 Tax=Orbilia ellipsospora TaxID=2528407 RepID=A0AAV9X846_9PEZI
MVDFLRGGLKPIILYVDIYALLVNYIHPLPLVTHRLAYYRHLTTAVLSSLGVSPEQIAHIDESSYAYTEAFTREFHKLIVTMRRQDAHCTSEVAETEMLSPLLCCLHQTLGEVFTDMDIQFGGLDQYELFTHSVTFLPLINHKRREHIMNNMVPSLKYSDSSPASPTISAPSSPSSKMSSSDSGDAKIEFLDDFDTIYRKISNADCATGDISLTNSILGLIREVIWPISEMRVERLEGDVGCNIREGLNLPALQLPFTSASAPQGTILTVHNSETSLQSHYSSLCQLERDYQKALITPQDLKCTVIAVLDQLLQPIREIYKSSEIWQDVERKAYPGGVY